MLPLHRLTSQATAPKNPMPHRHQQYGFSLLELVVVMGILAIFASVSLTFVGEKDVQQRYNESLEKLTMVKRNFFSVDKFQGQTVMHGFFIDNGMMGKSTPEAAVSTSFETLLNLREIPANPTTLSPKNSPQLKAKYKLFSFIKDIHLIDDEISPKEEHNLLIGAGLYKGIRPGAFDLSQYQDDNNEIRDAWGDEFEFNTELNVNVIQIKEKGYKNLSSSKSEVDISYSDLEFDSAALNIYVNNVTESNKFRLAIVSFNNSAACKGDVKDCWSTILSSPLLSTPSSTQTIFLLNETSLNNSGASFDHANNLIQKISPNVNEDTEPTSKITELRFTDVNDKEWSLIAQPLIDSASTEFNGNLTVGSHVVVLLELDTSTDTVAWKIHNSDPTSVNGNHIFEYLHIFPGQIPDPITMSIP